MKNATIEAIYYTEKCDTFTQAINLMCQIGGFLLFLRFFQVQTSDYYCVCHFCVKIHIVKGNTLFFKTKYRLLLRKTKQLIEIKEAQTHNVQRRARRNTSESRLTMTHLNHHVCIYPSSRICRHGIFHRWLLVGQWWDAPWWQVTVLLM